MASRRQRRLAWNAFVFGIGILVWGGFCWLVLPMVQSLPRLSLARIVLLGGSAVLILGGASRFTRD